MMKIVYTLEEVKNILCKFTCESLHAKEKPRSVTFIHKYPDGEMDIQDLGRIDRVEVNFKN